MRHDQESLDAAQFVDRANNGLFGLLVERRRRLVEDQDVRVVVSARAIATRCRSPPDSRTPRSPSRVSRPKGTTRPTHRDARGATQPRRGIIDVGVCTSERDVTPQRVVEQRECLRHVPDALLPGTTSVRMSRPSTSTLPACGSSRPSRTSTSVLLPAPVAPTIPTDSPRRTSGSRCPAPDRGPVRRYN